MGEMSDRDDDPENYRVEQEQKGPAGWLYYVERSRLPFPWEILGTSGIGITVPTPQEWDAYCEKHGAVWAKGRREKILQRLARRMLQLHGNGYFDMEDDWISINPVYEPPLTRLLSRLRR
jgi:hypothetical protein